MSNILERHLEENIEPNTTKESYIDKAIQIFQDMKPEDITKGVHYSDHKGKYCLCGLYCRMTGYRKDFGFMEESVNKLGEKTKEDLSIIHIQYCRGVINFEQMRQQAIDYMRSLK